MTDRTPQVREGRSGSSRPPAATCRDCNFAWYSATLAKGLRLLGSCPRCAGRLNFASNAGQAKRGDAPAAPATAPHLVLGLPRGRNRARA